MSFQDENLERVSHRIRGAIVFWYGEHERIGVLTFHVEELREFVTQVVGEVAPGSPDRVMRDLRQKGEIGYRVLSRSESWYEIIPKNGDEAEIEVEWEE